MSRKTPLLVSIAVATGVLLASGPVLANGGAFFSDMAAEGMYDPDAGVPFFGFIKDQRGRFVPHALVTLTVESGELSVAARADKMGLYRIPGFAKSIDPKGIDISCSKVGYRQVSSQRRIARGNDTAAIQVDCLMTPDKVASN